MRPAFGLQPHRLETFKLSTDPDFVAKVRDIVGLYVAPPERAVVLCGNEKSQIQALCSRFDPSGGAPQPRLQAPSHHIAVCCHPHRHRPDYREVLWTPSAQGVPKFLDEIEADVPDDLDFHLVMDNYATHKTRRR
jgi:hypothetical protein